MTGVGQDTPGYPITRNIARRKISLLKIIVAEGSLQNFAKKLMLTKRKERTSFCKTKLTSLGSLMKFDDQQEKENYGVLKSGE